MKRALVLSLLVIAGLTFAAIAAAPTGLYWNYKQGLTILEYGCEPECVSPPAWFEVGYNLYIETTFSDPCPDVNDCGEVIDTYNFVIDGNFYFANANIWSYPAAYITGFDLELTWLKWGFGVETELDFLANFDYWPNFIGLDDWTVETYLTRYFGNSFLSAGLDVLYRHFDPVGAWQLFPYIEVMIYFNE